ncbi:titin homolog [Mercenaria mercenaria]|uniref:titin homolog n=1 Tax=Mercenaria mercenaria TaxID=6596 RepID=UPI00234F1322|nr:titin homolog [Mercenaria mercenaria]
MTVNIVDEWKVYQTEDDLKEEDRIDHYWRQVFVKKLDSGQLKYRFLLQLVKKALVLPHGNLEVERSLSVNTSVVTKDRVALGEKTVTAIRTLKDIVKFSDPVDEQPHKIPLNSEILLAAKMAHNKYKQRIETGKEERAKKKQEREKERLEKKRLEELATEENNKTSSMLEKEKALLKKEMEIQTRLTVAEELLKDGNKKLSKAVESSDMKGASVAQMMIVTATSKIEGIRKEMDRVRENQREVEQQKRQLLVNRLDKCSSKSSSKGKKQESAISSSKSSATASTRTSKSEPDKQAASSSKSSPSSEKHSSKRKNEDKETDAKKSKKV